MKCFNYFIPTNFYVGPGQFNNLGKLAGTVGKKALIVCGRTTLDRDNLMGRISEMLAGEGLDYAIYNGVQPNPTTTIVDEGARILIDTGCDFLIAIGGGSSIDTAKGIAVAAHHKKPIWNFMNPEGEKEKIVGAYPLIAVPTTSGTGSEADGAAVITNPETSLKPSFKSYYTFPRFSIIDPELVVSLSPSMTASTGIDAFCQSLECYVGPAATPVSDMFAHESLKLCIENLIKVYEDGNDIDARSNMAWAAALSGMAMATSATSLVHALEHPLSGKYNITHGDGLAALLPSFIEFGYKYNPKRYADITRLFISDFDNIDEMTLATMLKNEVLRLLESLG
ncbi:MAG: iron-containing alcohol dehydrogenase, partial [Thermoanaerobacteraceae bacterium]|nr:iron-containing alcohol dehydrogenase [Thermoanaerobacteraceae bacterium]